MCTSPDAQLLTCPLLSPSLTLLSLLHPRQQATAACEASTTCGGGARGVPQTVRVRVSQQRDPCTLDSRYRGPHDPVGEGGPWQLRDLHGGHG